MRLLGLLLIPSFAAAAPVAETTGDIGKVTLDADGTLTAAGTSVKLAFDRAEGADKSTTLQVVSLGGKKRGIVVTSPTDGDEDPPPRHRVFLVGKTLDLAFDEILDTEITFSPKGTGRYIESAWAACTRVHAKKVRKQVVTLTLVGKKLKSTRKPSTEVQECGDLAACPFVYIDGRLAGEILRNVRYEPALQSLYLGTGGHLRLTEEKPETTYIDELYLEVDGVRRELPACVADPTLAYCRADGRYFVMTRGAALDLDIASGTLFALGYYIPES